MVLKICFFIACFTVCYAGVPKIIGNARPCFLNDYGCIQRNLAANSNCRPLSRPVRSPYFIRSHRFEAPAFNATYVDNNMEIRGLERCYVSEFFYDVDGDSGVLGVDCPGLNFVSDRQYFQHRPLQEDAVYNYKINGTYPLIRLTMTLVNVDKLNICNEFTSAYITHLPFFHIDPKDRKTQSTLSRDFAMLSVFERETFFYRAGLLIREVINARLCDFGCY